MSSAGQAVLTGTERGFRKVVSRNSSGLALHHRRTVLQRDVAAGSHDVRGGRDVDATIAILLPGDRIFGASMGSATTSKCRETTAGGGR